METISYCGNCCRYIFTPETVTAIAQLYKSKSIGQLDLYKIFQSIATIMQQLIILMRRD